MTPISLTGRHLLSNAGIRIHLARLRAMPTPLSSMAYPYPASLATKPHPTPVKKPSMNFSFVTVHQTVAAKDHVWQNCVVGRWHQDTDFVRAQSPKRHFMKKESKSLKTIPFDVHIPNLDGDGIAQTIRIEVTAFTDPDSGEDILTPESLELIEKIQARHMG